MLFHGIGFSGQQRLVDEEVLGFEQAAVGRHQVARRQQHHIAGHQLLHRQVLAQIVAQHRGTNRDRLLQAVDGASGAKFLDEIEGHAHQHDGPDDDEAGELAGQRRGSAGRQQDHHQRILEVAQVLQDEMLLGLNPQGVRAEGQESPAGLLAAQAQGRRSQLCLEFRGGKIPELRVDMLHGSHANCCYRASGLGVGSAILVRVLQSV